MSSRLVRKTLGHTQKKDVIETLQKVGRNASGKDLDDEENDLVPTSSSNTRQNVFELLADANEDDHNKSPDCSDHSSGDQHEPKQQTVGKARRKRKPKKKAPKSQQNDEIDDEFPVMADPIPVESTTTVVPKEWTSNLLSIDARFLNPLNEMKKKFGSAIVEQMERENNPNMQTLLTHMPPQRRRALQMAHQQRPSTRISKQNTFIFCKLGWPPYSKNGLLMKPSAPISETSSAPGNYFKYEFDSDYQRLQIKYLDHVDQHDLQGIMDILRQYPYHVDALVHLSDVSRMQDDTATAVDLLERALYSFQQSFHPLFSMTRGECRLEYRIQENRSFFISLFKNIIYIGERGCTRTALEFCKALLSLNPTEDPLAVLLLLDYYAIRCTEYDYLIRFHSEQNLRLNLDGLPNFAYSISLAHFRKQLFEKADEMLQDALLRFPSILKYILDKLSVRPDRNVENAAYFNNERQDTDALKCVQQLYVTRMANEWKNREELEFLRTNVNRVIEIVDKNQDRRIALYSKMRQSGYRKTPINICRHLVLSESNEIRGFLPNDLENGQTFYSFDPFPPRDSIAGFQRPPRPEMRISGSYNPLNMIIRSLFPNFNVDNYLVPANAEQGAAARGNTPNEDVGMLQAIQESIRTLIQDIGINHFGDEEHQPQREQDGDDSEPGEFD